MKKQPATRKPMLYAEWIAAHGAAQRAYIAAGKEYQRVTNQENADRAREAIDALEATENDYPEYYAALMLDNEVGEARERARMRDAARQTEPTTARNDCIVCSRQIENEGDPVCSRCQCDKCNQPHDNIWLEDDTKLCEECADSIRQTT